MITREILRLAAAILPAHRKPWGQAMLREVDFIEPATEAISFALGCLWAACSERISLMKLIVAIGRWSVGLVTIAYGAVMGLGVWFFSTILLGLTHDRYYDLLVAGHQTDAAVMRLHSYGFMLAHDMLETISYIVAGVFLIRWRVRPFIWSCLAAVMGPVMMMSFGVYSSSPIYTSYFTSFIPWIMLLAAALFFWWLEQSPKRPTAAI